MYKWGKLGVIETKKTEKHPICHKEPGYGKKPQPILPTIKT
jgi:hypothetical protein